MGVQVECSVMCPLRRALSLKKSEELWEISSEESCLSHGLNLNNSGIVRQQSSRRGKNYVIFLSLFT